MTDNTPVLRSRAAPATRTRETHDVEMARAMSIAKAGDMLPKSYRANPGAVLLAQVWADAHDIDLITTMQSVSFIQGKPFVSAEMQAAMAERAGYELRTVELSDTSATVELWRGDRLLGAETVTMDDAKRAGWATGAMWAKLPRNMLLARARTNAVRFYAPSVLLGLKVEGEEGDVTTDPVAVLDAEPEVKPEVEGQQSLDDIAEAEIVPDAQPEPEVDGPAADELVTEVRDAIAAAKSAGTWPALATQLQDAGIPLQPHRLTDAQARFVLDAIGTE